MVSDGYRIRIGPIDQRDRFGIGLRPDVISEYRIALRVVDRSVLLAGRAAPPISDNLYIPAGRLYHGCTRMKDQTEEVRSSYGFPPQWKYRH